MKKRIAALAIGVMAAGVFAGVAVADEPVGGLEGSKTGCGLHLDHADGPGFYTKDDEGNFRACTQDDARAELGV